MAWPHPAACRRAPEPCRRRNVLAYTAAWRVDDHPAWIRSAHRARDHTGASDQLCAAGAHDDLRAAQPPPLEGVRPVEPGNRFLRRFSDLSCALARGDRATGPHLFPVLWSGRVTNDDCRIEARRTRHRQPYAIGLLRPACALGGWGAAR